MGFFDFLTPVDEREAPPNEAAVLEASTQAREHLRDDMVEGSLKARESTWKAFKRRILRFLFGSGGEKPRPAAAAQAGLAQQAPAAAPAATMPPPAAADQEAFRQAVIETGGERNGAATEQLPYRTHVTLGPTGKPVWNSGAPGYPGGSGRFSPELAKSQLEHLYGQGLRVIVSLDAHPHIPAVVEELNQRLSPPITYVTLGGRHPVVQTSGLTASNRALFETVSQHINGGQGVLIHCRHGAHRAPATTACALAKAYADKKAPIRVERAMEMAGVEAARYRQKDLPNGTSLYAQIDQYVQEVNAQAGRGPDSVV